MAVKDLFITRDIADLVDETGGEGEQLQRTIGPFALTALGVGAIIGTGIFVVIGQGAELAGGWPRRHRVQRGHVRQYAQCDVADDAGDEQDDGGQGQQNETAETVGALGRLFLGCQN